MEGYDNVDTIDLYCVAVQDDIGACQVGGKAAGLGRAARAGLRVPLGFVITCKALGSFLDATELRKDLDLLLAERIPHDRAESQRLYGDLCAKAMRAPLPEPVRKDVERHVTELLRKAPLGLAVRSSGVLEDSARASFAGVYRSFLCISSLDQFWESVRQCWYSFWSPTAIEYARRMGVEPCCDQMAVLVQPVLHAESSGVLFTSDPITGNPWQFVLNSVFGLAEDLVSGRAPSDHFVLEWETGDVLEKEIVEKPEALLPSPSGSYRTPLRGPQRTSPSLLDEAAKQIARLGLGLDRAFGCRVDIEWVVTEGVPWIVQVRPITSLPSYFPLDLSSQEEQRVWKRVRWFDDNIVPPLFADQWASEQWRRYEPKDRLLGHAEYTERDVNGRRFATELIWAGNPLGNDGIEQWLDANEATLQSEWLSARKAMQDASSVSSELIEGSQCAADLIPGLLAMIELQNDTQARIFGPPQTMHDYCGHLLQSVVSEIRPGFPTDDLRRGFPCFSHQRTCAAQELGRLITEDFVKQAFLERPLTDVIPHLSRTDNSTPAHETCAFLSDYEAFCRRFGLCPPSWRNRPSRWSQAQFTDPAQVLLSVKNALLGQGRNAEDVLSRVAERRAAAEQEIRAIARRQSPILLERLNKTIRWSQFWEPVLDDRTWSLVPYFSLLDLL